jgi:hypothetical protein
MNAALYKPIRNIMQTGQGRADIPSWPTPEELGG